MPIYSIEADGKKCQIKLLGDITAVVVPELQEALKGAIGGGATEVEFDFAGTTMLDSSGIGLLVAAGNTLGAKKGAVRLVNVSTDIMRLLQSMRLVGRLNAVGK